MNHLLVHPREENPPGEVHLLLRQDRLLVPHVEILRERLLDGLAVVALVQVEARRRREGRVRAENMTRVCLSFPVDLLGEAINLMSSVPLRTLNLDIVPW